MYEPWECVIYVLGQVGEWREIYIKATVFILSAADACVYLSNCSIMQRLNNVYAVKDVNVIAEIGTDCDGKDDLQFTPVPAKTLT